MSRRRRRNSLAVGLLAVPLTAVLFLHLHCQGNRPSNVRDITLEGHTSPVQALAFSPDGSTLTTAACSLQSPGGQGEVSVWDTETGLCRATRSVPLGELLTLTFAPGARTLATAGRDGTVRLWGTSSGHEPRRLRQDPALVSALAFSADVRQLAAADHLQVTVWDLAAGRQTDCQGHEQRSCALAFAPDARTLATGNDDGTIHLWDAVSGHRRSTLRGHTRAVLTLAYSPDGRLLASGDFGGTIKLWDVNAEQAWATLMEAGEEAVGLVFSPDGQTLAAAVDRTVQLWDVDARRLVARLEGHAGKVKCLAYSPDGTRLASGSYNGAVRLWDVARIRPRTP